MFTSEKCLPFHWPRKKKSIPNFPNPLPPVLNGHSLIVRKGEIYRGKGVSMFNQNLLGPVRGECFLTQNS